MTPNMTRRPRRVHTPLTLFIEKNQRFSEENIHGIFHSLSTGDALDSGTDIVFTSGLSKLVFVLNAGSDFAGTITVTGTTVDRDTGAETGADTDDIVIDALSTDTSDTDAEGQPRYALSGSYITSKWFKGAVTISTANVTLTDVDSYQCAFEQWHDQGIVVLEAFDITGTATNTAAWLYAYLYAVMVTGSKMVLTREASIEAPASGISADTHYRYRRGSIGKTLDGSTDGCFVHLFFGPSSQTYWTDVNIKVWAKADIA